MKPVSQKQYIIDDLVYLMSRLRDPDTGCPWDLKQDYRSITPSTIEEAYEVVDAIERNDLEHLKEELGDCLFQVVFYAQLANEEYRWDFSDVVHGITEKLIRRHPHVFPEGTLLSRRNAGDTLDDEGIKTSWESIKQGEREEKGKTGALDDVPTALPALQRAQKLQKRAARVGFDWTEARQVLDKIHEEVAELENAFSDTGADDRAELIAEELGDLMFSCVNLSRHLKRDAEQLLRSANSKFERRFRHVEAQLQEKGRCLEEATLEEMDDLWQHAKNRLETTNQV